VTVTRVSGKYKTIYTRSHNNEINQSKTRLGFAWKRTITFSGKVIFYAAIVRKKERNHGPSINWCHRSIFEREADGRSPTKWGLCAVKQVMEGPVHLYWVMIWFTWTEVEFLRAVVMKSSIFWDIMSCSPLKVNRSYGGTGRLHIQGLRVSQVRNQHEA
jgi:hypothetical protein